MENSQISNVKSSRDLKLAPETIRIRDAIVEKYLDEPLDTLSGKLQSLISEETDTGTRLGILSARVEILRMRFAEITGRTYKKDSESADGGNPDEESEIDQDEIEDEKEGWMTLRILEASEVNGVRFPEGVKIDVHTEDAKKLLESKKAELVSVTVEDIVESDPIDGENPIEEQENDANEAEVGDEKEAETSSSEGSSDETTTEGVKAEEVSDLIGDKSDAKETRDSGAVDADGKSTQEEKTDNASKDSGEVTTDTEETIPSEESQQPKTSVKAPEDVEVSKPSGTRNLAENQTKAPEGEDSNQAVDPEKKTAQKE